MYLRIPFSAFFVRLKVHIPITYAVTSDYKDLLLLKFPAALFYPHPLKIFDSKCMPVRLDFIVYDRSALNRPFISKIHSPLVFSTLLEQNIFFSGIYFSKDTFLFEIDTYRCVP